MGPAPGVAASRRRGDHDRGVVGHGSALAGRVEVDAVGLGQQSLESPDVLDGHPQSLDLGKLLAPVAVALGHVSGYVLSEGREAVVYLKEGAERSGQVTRIN